VTSWRVESATGSAAEFHARELPVPLERSAWVLDVDGPALVLGSTQVDTVRPGAGIEVVRRRSGGGAVLLQPGDLWIDLLLPRDDPLWVDDVGRAAHWVGDVFAAAVGEGAVVHRGGLLRTPWSGAVCFAGLGPGEVTDGEGGPKLIGISQRRTRIGARFQCAALRRWDAVGIAELLQLPSEAATELATAAAGVDLTAAAVLARLP
jgi:lipoate-protein ligase A